MEKLTIPEFRDKGLKLARIAKEIGVKLDVTSRMGLMEEYRNALDDASDIFESMHELCIQHRESI